MGTAAVGSTSTDVSVLKIESLRKSYGKCLALNTVTLEIRSGEIYGILGPDGAGKSSLMKAVAGVLTFDRGTIDVFGIRLDSERAAEKVKGRIGFMPQGLGLNLYPELTIGENIDFFARLRLVNNEELSERKERLLAITRLDRFRERPMKNLSGGMKQKLGLVCTLIHNPDLVILDEPTTGVDPVSRRDFWAILAELLRVSGITALISTAYMDEATRFHRTSTMFDGNIVAQGEPDEILALVPGSVVTLSTVAQVEALRLLKGKFAQVQALGQDLRIFVERKSEDEAVKEVKALLSGLETSDMKSSEPELEDVFVALLRQKQLVKGDSVLKMPPSWERHLGGREKVAVEAKELVRDFGRFRAVDRVNFHINQGEIFGLLGANGAGKTTVIKMLTGILRPTSGEGLVAGSDMHSAGRAIKERIGYMSQAFSLYQDLSVLENIRLYAGIYGLSVDESKKQANWIIDMAGLSGYETILSGSLPMGVRQRLALGCALVHRPQILFLDEPTSGVDPIGRRRFWDILFRLSREEGVAILITTHYMSEAEHCDHLALMYAGRVVADASPAAMKRQVEDEAGSLLEVATDRPLVALGLLKKEGFEGVALFGKHIHLLARMQATAEQQIRKTMEKNGITLFSIVKRTLTMEDVFVYRILMLERQEKAA